MKKIGQKIFSYERKIIKEIFNGKKNKETFCQNLSKD